MKIKITLILDTNEFPDMSEIFKYLKGLEGRNGVYVAQIENMKVEVMRSFE